MIKIDTDNASKLFLAIEIDSDIVKTASWQIVNGIISVVDTGSIQPWQPSGKNKSLITALRDSLSDLQLRPLDLHEVIFGLPELWLENDRIQENYKTILKSISSALSFKPLGFVSVSEAILKDIKQNQDQQVSALLMHLHTNKIILTIASKGVITQTVVVGRTDDIGIDVEEGLSRFSSKTIFPSKIVLFNGDSDLQQVKAKLQHHSWEHQKYSQHPPEYEVLEANHTIKAIVHSGGAEVAQQLGYDIHDANNNDFNNASFDNLTEEEVPLNIDDDVVNVESISDAASIKKKSVFSKLLFWKRPL